MSIFFTEVQVSGKSTGFVRHDDIDEAEEAATVEHEEDPTVDVFIWAEKDGEPATHLDPVKWFRGKEILQ